ncbi:MAG: cytochrome c oxidase subunit 3 [Flavobacteriales bacterium]|jgi:cytochrome c oxidase subunit 3|nr:cytochrome c oxidase subunit 3 [Flavobacteriales bacterium]MBK6550640.1 cytochrome c oxidase subunit 3 [Flavobacteriales bacterium]MBK6884865.1 cytochrome c oxidase subunit 3 [Flavobacteriales bacterium]MBK7103264.1 cytochrome c oxidase subunit 3 [Flavobacteriales bacterium]MBK7112653.1 cytochrome c oxidase subunit 3 [Flavobacteriales bacterium]
MAGDASKVLSNDVLWGGGRSPFSISYGKMMMWFFLVSDALTFGGLLTAYGFVRHSTTEVWPIGEEVFRALPGLTGSYPLVYVALMTAILIFSSVTMVLAVEAGHRMDKKGVIKWLFLTVLGGAFFVGSQAWEWSHFIHGSGGYITTNIGEKYWVHNDEHDTHDPTAHESFHLVLADPAHYLIPAEGAPHLDHAASLKLWNDRATYVDGANMTVNEYGPIQYANFFFFITGFHGFHVFSGVIINLIVLIMVINGVFHRRGHYEMVEKAGLYWHFVDLVWVFVFTFFYLL